MTWDNTNLIPERCDDTTHEHREVQGFFICDVKASYWMANPPQLSNLEQNLLRWLVTHPEGTKPEQLHPDSIALVDSLVARGLALTKRNMYFPSTRAQVAWVALKPAEEI